MSLVAPPNQRELLRRILESKDKLLELSLVDTPGTLKIKGWYVAQHSDALEGLAAHFP